MLQPVGYFLQFEHRLTPDAHDTKASETCGGHLKGNYYLCVAEMKMSLTRLSALTSHSVTGFSTNSPDKSSFCQKAQGLMLLLFKLLFELVKFLVSV